MFLKGYCYKRRDGFNKSWFSSTLNENDSCGKRFSLQNISPFPDVILIRHALSPDGVGFDPPRPPDNLGVLGWKPTSNNSSYLNIFPNTLQDWRAGSLLDLWHGCSSVYTSLIDIENEEGRVEERENHTPVWTSSVVLNSWGSMLWRLSPGNTQNGWQYSRCDFSCFSVHNERAALMMGIGMAKTSGLCCFLLYLFYPISLEVVWRQCFCSLLWRKCLERFHCLKWRKSFLDCLFAFKSVYVYRTTQSWLNSSLRFHSYMTLFDFNDNMYCVKHTFRSQSHQLMIKGCCVTWPKCTVRSNFRPMKLLPLLT